MQNQELGGLEFSKGVSTVGSEPGVGTATAL